MDSKKWYASKTLWTNTLALISIIVQGITGKEIISLEIQATALAVINLVLRLITKQEVVW